MKRRISFLLLIISGLLLLAACALPATDRPDMSEEYTLEWLSGLSPDTILIRESYEPTFSRREMMYPFGRVVPFTLYADGHVFYIASGEDTRPQVYTAQLTAEETLEFVREFMGLGFSDLEDYLDMCMSMDGGEPVCIADDSYVILEATMASGVLRSVKSYGAFSNLPDVMADIRLMLDTFSAPDAQPFTPETATLFVSNFPEDGRENIEWPLDPALLKLYGNDVMASVLENPALSELIAAAGRNMGDIFVEYEGKNYIVLLVPWLPGEDFRAEIAEAFPIDSPPETATPEPYPEPIFIIAENARMDLAEKLGIDPESIVVFDVEQVEWPDGCLGIVIKDELCIQVIVPGFRLLLEAEGVTYEYRSDMEGSVLRAADGLLPFPEFVPESISILSPGAGSRIVSPLKIYGEADPAFEQTIVVRILLADGTQLALEPVIIQSELGTRGPYEAEIPFAVEGEQQGFVQVYVTSARDGGILHLNSIGVLLAESGAEEIRLESHETAERIHISRPVLGETLHTGIVHIEGIALASFEQTLIVEILDENGAVLASSPVIVQAPDWGVPGAFSADLPLTVSMEGAGRVVVRDPSMAFLGDVHLASVEVRLAP